jgi:prophage regulatory protein
LRLDAVRAATGLGRATIYERMAEGTFPRPVKLLGEGSKAVGWVGSEIAAWQRVRIAARDNAVAA